MPSEILEKFRDFLTGVRRPADVRRTPFQSERSPIKTFLKVEEKNRKKQSMSQTIDQVGAMISR